MGQLLQNNLISISKNNKIILIKILEEKFNILTSEAVKSETDSCDWSIENSSNLSKLHTYCGMNWLPAIGNFSRILCVSKRYNELKFPSIYAFFVHERAILPDVVFGIVWDYLI